MEMLTLTKPVNPGSAKDYFEAEMMFTTGPVELDRMRKQNPDSIQIVDVRDPEDFAQGCVPGSINLPKAQWGSLERLHKNKNNILLCYSSVCHLAKMAAVEFASKGYPVMEMDGGFKAWQEHDLEIQHTHR